MENVMSSPESRLIDAAGVVRPAGFEFKQGPNTASLLQAESLLAAEKQTLEMMANGASLSEVLNDLCVSIDAPAPPCYFNGLFDGRRVAVAVCRVSCPCHVQSRYHPLADRSRQGFLRRSRVHQTKGDRSQYFQRS